MSTGRVIHRETGATATLTPTGQPVVTSVTGGRMDVVTRPSEPGFNPLDLLYASLSACLVLSARIAASERGLLGRIERLEATVRGVKAQDGPSRLAGIEAILLIEGDLDDATRRDLRHAAESICTISNTLRAAPAILMAD
jgi:uncharacterized OsmC-like protein